MKRKILIAVYVILVIIMLDLIVINVVNNFIINKYKNGEYLQSQARFLTNITFQKSYISNYNYGNILYKKGEYEQAIIEYKKALKTVTSFEKECKIRINYALAMCQNVQVDTSNKGSISKAIETYENAIEKLTEKECSNHNRDAKKLKEDIESEIERLKKLQKDIGNKSEQKNTKENIQEKEENNIEEKIQAIKEEAIKGQREIENTYKNLNKDYNDRGKNW